MLADTVFFYHKENIQFILVSLYKNKYSTKGKGKKTTKKGYEDIIPSSQKNTNSMTSLCVGKLSS